MEQPNSSYDIHFIQKFPQNFNHKNNFSDNEIPQSRSKMLEMFEQERRAVWKLIYEEKHQKMLNRLRYLKQQCKCRMICTG